MSDPLGFLNVDKPEGMTSHDVVARVRRVAGMRRVGHAGTLDPLATGVLLVGLGRATRLIEYLVGQPKTYVARVRLGQTTNTYDADGEITAEMPVTSTQAEIEAALTPFQGEIAQRAPIYSAIKKDGQPLYKRARRGEAVEAPVRNVTIYDLALVAFESPFVELRVVCSAGTYIRSLAHDLGQALGCGGHIAALRRTAIGSFSAETALPLADLTADMLTANLLSPDSAVGHLPRLDLNPSDSATLLHGGRLTRQPDQPQADLVRAYDADGRFVGVVASRDNGALWQPRKLLISAG